MRAILLLSFFMCVHAGYGVPSALIISPDTAQTFSYSHIVDHSLRWDSNARALTASITFSNVNYVSDRERLVDETFDFTFQHVRFDERTRTYHARTAAGEMVPVATSRKGPCGDTITPWVGARFHIFKRSGRARIVLVVDINAAFDRHWIEHNDGFFLQNLIARRRD